MRALLAAQQEDVRVVRLPAGRPALLSQPAPNPRNDNSAIVSLFQVRTQAGSPHHHLCG